MLAGFRKYGKYQMEEKLQQIFSDICQHHETPVKIGNRCQSHDYYHIENLSSEDLRLCSEVLLERILNVCYPQAPELLLKLPSCYSDLALLLQSGLRELDRGVELVELSYSDLEETLLNYVKDTKLIIVADVLTSARSCLEVHSLATMYGGSVLAWLSLIDRT